MFTKELTVQSVALRQTSPASNEDKMTTISAVAYVRMSIDKEEASPKQQREAIERLAAGKYRIVRWHQDDGISGDGASAGARGPRTFTSSTCTTSTSSAIMKRCEAS